MLSLIVVGSILRFYNLTWGAPFYFHPDERNIASSVSQLLFPTNMHPHFFAYGSLPIYTIYFTGVFVNAISQLPNWPVNWSSLGHVSFETAIIISRFSYTILSVQIHIFDKIEKELEAKQYSSFLHSLRKINEIVLGVQKTSKTIDHAK